MPFTHQFGFFQSLMSHTLSAAVVLASSADCGRCGFARERTKHQKEHKNEPSVCSVNTQTKRS
jgi:hypothetical protein